MPNGRYEITDDQFMNMSEKEQNLMMFRTYNVDRQETDKRLCKLERRTKVDTAVSGFGGFLGGVVAMLIKWGIFKEA